MQVCPIRASDIPDYPILVPDLSLLPSISPPDLPDQVLVDPQKIMTYQLISKFPDKSISSLRTRIGGLIKKQLKVEFKGIPGMSR